MIFLEPAFVPFALAVIALCAVRDGGLRDAWTGLGVNVAFIGLFLGPAQGAILVAFSLAGWAAVRLAGSNGGARLASAVVASVALFVVLKKYSFLPELLRPDSLPVAVGLSYVLFRVLHLAIDHGQGSGPELRPVEHLAYTLNAFALLSGPFQRYEEYREILEKAERHDPLPALARVGNGLLKVVLVAPVLKAVHGALAPGLAASPAIAAAAVIATSLVWLVFMYFNFSGYMDIVIGWARLCRLDLPENFDRPWRASGFLDFWGRWHMTMTGWFKTYVFSQLLMLLGRRFPRREWATALSGAAFFATFLLVGAWHGPTPPFIACGVLLGIGATVNQVFREWVRTRTRQGRKPRAAPGLGVLGAGFSFCYIAVAVAPFWLDGAAYARALLTFSTPTGLAVLAVGSLAAGVLAALVSAIDPAIERLVARAAPLLHSSPAVAVRLVVVVLLAIVAADALPDFVYKGI